MTTKQEHLEDLRKHDWSYCMSDDNNAYRRGTAQESALLAAEHRSVELAGMYETYRKWWWDLADGSNTIGSGKGRSAGESEPTF